MKKFDKPSLRLAASATPDTMGGLDDNVRFAQIVLPHIDDAYRLAHWLTGNGTDAEDVVQDASLSAFRAIRGYAGGSARAWLLTLYATPPIPGFARTVRPQSLPSMISQRSNCAGQTKPPRCGNAGDSTSRQSRRRAASFRDCGFAGAVSRNAGATRHRRPGLPRDCPDDRSPDWHRHVAACSGPSPANKTLGGNSHRLIRRPG